jgi:Tol biopolymer transport system component
MADRLGVTLLAVVVAASAAIATAKETAKPAASAAGAAPTATTSTARLCYTKDKAIYVAAADGSGAEKWGSDKRLVDTRISPDAKTIAVTIDKSKDDGPMHRVLGLVNGKGVAVAEIPGVPGENNYYPIWSPDGQLLMFSHYAGNDWHVGVVGRDGTGFRDVTAKLADSDSFQFTGWWAADSKSLYAYDFKNVYQVALDGRELSRTPVKEYFGDAELSSGYNFSLSPDGKRLLVDASAEVKDIKSEEGPPSLIFLHDFASKISKRLSPKGVSGIKPSWLPDGRTLVFRRTDATSQGVCLMDAESGKLRMLIKGADDPSLSR